jgi:uncharacterized membrane protein SpoIIM required for sporulation
MVASVGRAKSSGPYVRDKLVVFSRQKTIYKVFQEFNVRAELNINDFIRERKKDWESLAGISGKRQGKNPNLTRDEVWQLARLYFTSISDLSVLRSSEFGRDPDNPVLNYLNDLVIRVHGIIYRKPEIEWVSIKDFFATEFPATFQKNVRYFLISTGIFVLLGVAGFFISVAQPGFIELLVPPHIINKVEHGQVWFNDLFAIAPAASSMLMTHNISVTFLIIASGMTFGLVTVYLLALNGLLIGTIGALCWRHDLSMELWSFVLPHGSMELTAIFLGGAAGLILGHALIDPGPYRRGEYLAVRGREAGKLALGCVPLLVFAGITEAFISPSPLPAWTKLVLASIFFSLVMGYFFKPLKAKEQSDESGSHEVQVRE